MQRFTLFLLLLFCAVLIGGTVSAPVRAEYYTWHHQPSGVYMTFPDTWRVAHNQKPDDIVTVQAPGERDYASCRVRRREDQRTLMYPYQYDRSLQHLYIGYDFWQDYVGEYNGAILERVLSDRGLLNTYASSADFTFISAAGPKTLMHGFAFAGYDHGFVYIFECSAEVSSYERWYPVFKSILKSTYKQLNDTILPNGSYREFLHDGFEVIYGHGPLDAYKR